MITIQLAINCCWSISGELALAQRKMSSSRSHSQIAISGATTYSESTKNGDY